MREINVTVEWHEDAKLWIATSQDIWGLAAQAADFETLRKKVLPMIEDLVELNNVPIEGTNIPVNFIAESTSNLQLKSVA